MKLRDDLYFTFRIEWILKALCALTLKPTYEEKKVSYE